MTFDADFYYWFYSTVAQSLAALIGVGGVFAVFRLQLLEKEAEQTVQNLKDFFLKMDFNMNARAKVASWGFDELFSQIRVELKDIERHLDTKKVRIQEFEKELNANAKPDIQNDISRLKKEQTDLRDRKTNLVLKLKHYNNIPIFKKYLQKRLEILIGALTFIFLLSLFLLGASPYFEKDFDHGVSALASFFVLLFAGIILFFRFFTISLQSGKDFKNKSCGDF